MITTTIKHWTHYRWNEGSQIIWQHKDFQDKLNAIVLVVSARLADFCFKKYYCPKN